MTSAGVQQLFFNHIKGLIPPHVSFAEELAAVLNISNDSAYRRIRGEKPISLEEIRILCNRYKISLDQLLHVDADSVLFTGKRADTRDFVLENYLQDFLLQHDIINSFEQRELLILSKDIPLYHYNNFPILAAFKYFFWIKTILNDPAYSKATFDPSCMPESILRISAEIIRSYNRIPSTEIWHVENINTTLRQIEYYKESNAFSCTDDIIQVFDALERSIDHVELQAEAGYKINQPGNGPSEGAPFNLYVNDFILGDNTYMPIMNGKKKVFLVHTFLNYMSTSDEAFVEYTYRHFQNILHKSTLISGVGEKSRRLFFNRIREHISARKSIVLNGNVLYGS